MYDSDEVQGLLLHPTVICRVYQGCGSKTNANRGNAAMGGKRDCLQAIREHSTRMLLQTCRLQPSHAPAFGASWKSSCACLPACQPTTGCCCIRMLAAGWHTWHICRCACSRRSYSTQLQQHNMPSSAWVRCRLPNRCRLWPCCAHGQLRQAPSQLHHSQLDSQQHQAVLCASMQRRSRYTR